jgi:hypothetical protein
MEYRYKKYGFTPQLGWSISRYEVFDKCKRQYYYTYYGKYDDEVPGYKIIQLKNLTSVPLEIGNIVHDIIETFLRRLQKSDSAIDENRFYTFARQKAEEYFSTKTFIEVFCGYRERVDIEYAIGKINTCLRNFISSPCYNWIFMKAITNKENWLIEPDRFGETRLNGLKAYCKMDFLFPVDGYIYILDWKTGKKDTFKHRNQLISYAASANATFGIPLQNISPKIIYLDPEFEEFEFQLCQNDLDNFFALITTQTGEMYSYCSDTDQNIPKEKSFFPKNPVKPLCRLCRFQQLCFPNGELLGESIAFD